MFVNVCCEDMYVVRTYVVRTYVVRTYAVEDALILCSLINAQINPILMVAIITTLLLYV